MNILKLLWQKWLVLARTIGNFQSQVILTIFYLVILAPVGFLFRVFSDPLRIKAKVKSNFVAWEHKKQTVEEARKQY